MKASEFIKQHGLEAAKDAVVESDAYSGLWINARTLELSKYIPSYDAVFIPELKTAVEAWKFLIAEFESLEMAEYEYMISASYSEPYWVKVGLAIKAVQS